MRKRKSSQEKLTLFDAVGMAIGGMVRLLKIQPLKKSPPVLNLAIEYAVNAPSASARNVVIEATMVEFKKYFGKLTSVTRCL